MNDAAASLRPSGSPVSVDVRPLGERDLPDVVRVHLAAFPESAISALGAGAAMRYYRWQLTGPHDCVALGLDAGPEFAGFCFGGTFRGALTGFVRRHRAFLAWRIATHPWLLLHTDFRRRLSLGAHLARVRTTTAPSNHEPPRAERVRSFGILSIAVDPRFQGAGYGMRLMSEAERIARSRGFAQMHLTVHPGNMQAVRVYERCGWVRVTDTDRWNGSMRKMLSPALHSGEA